MLVTLNTDGSFSHQTKEAGFAFWISCDAGRFKKYGSLLMATNSGEAEIMAIINGLHYIRTHPQLKYCTRIIVNTDCIPAIDIAKNTDGLKRKKQEKLRELRDIMHKYMAGVPCEFRHVKAHVKSDTTRGYVNKWLDKHAKIGRKYGEG